MTKAIRVAYTIGIILILYFVAIFGVKAFYPEGSYYDYQEKIKNNCGSYPTYEQLKCSFDTNATLESTQECKKQEKALRETYEEANNQYLKCSERYNPGNHYKRNIFIIENIMGIVFVIIAFFLLRISLLANGAAFAGVLLIIDGFYEGWRVSEKTLQFSIGLVILAVFIITAIALNKKTSKE
ncbi:MAG: hypothetical protein AABY00_00420 [Nanoarchaeota archaeon]